MLTFGLNPQGTILYVQANTSFQEELKFCLDREERIDMMLDQLWGDPDTYSFFTNDMLGHDDSEAPCFAELAEYVDGVVIVSGASYIYKGWGQKDMTKDLMSGSRVAFNLM